MFLTRPQNISSNVWGDQNTILFPTANQVVSCPIEFSCVFFTSVCLFPDLLWRLTLLSFQIPFGIPFLKVYIVCTLPCVPSSSFSWVATFFLWYFWLPMFWIFSLFYLALVILFAGYHFFEFLCTDLFLQVNLEIKKNPELCLSRAFGFKSVVELSRVVLAAEPNQITITVLSQHQNVKLSS